MFYEKRGHENLGNSPLGLETLTRRTSRQYLGQMSYEIVGFVALLPGHRCSYQKTDQRSPTMVILEVACPQDLNLTVRHLTLAVQLHEE